MAKRTNYRWLMQQSATIRYQLLLTISLSIFSGILIIFQAWILAHLIDQITIHQINITLNNKYIIALVFITLCRMGSTGFREYTGFQTAKKVKEKIRTELFNTLFKTATGPTSKKKTGKLATTIIEQVEALHNFYADYLPQMSIVILLPLIILTLVFMKNWVCGLILLITGPLIPLFMALIGMGVEALNQKQFKSLARISNHFLNVLQGLTTLSLYHRANAQINTIEKMSNAYRIKTMHVLRVAFLSSAVLELFSTIAIAIVAVYLGLGLLHIVHFGLPKTSISLQNAFFILLLAPEFFMPLRQLGTYYHARGEAIAAVTDLSNILTPKTQTAQSEHAAAGDRLLPTPQPIKKIQVANIGFAYPSKPTLFSDISFEIAVGSSTALTGPSGIGKTTFLKLLCALQTPSTGEILINGQNLTKIDPDDWHQQIIFLNQHPYLFHATIAENIRLAKPNATEAQIYDAAKKAGVLAFANQLPNGLHTLIGEQHIGLSGGQAQRVALARTYLKDAPILLLDEPTAHLDSDNKQFIINALSHWQDKTIVIATHDTDLIQFCSQEVNLNSNE